MLNKIEDFYYSIPWPWPFVIILLFMGCFALVAVLKKHLTNNGGFAAFLTGVVVLWCARIGGFVTLCFFYFSSYVIGHFSKMIAGDDNTVKKGHTRDWVQVFANGLMAVLASLYWYNTGYIGALLMFGSAMAEASSDTWAGEIGRLSIKPPVSIRTFQAVPKGLSGGVTALGFFGAFMGSFLTSLVWFFTLPIKINFISVLVVSLCGFSGCIFDSYLGATFQAMYLDEKNDTLTEKDLDADGKARKLVRGIKWLDNDIVNLFSNLLSAIIAVGISKLF